jgi:hypothetical protein
VSHENVVCAIRTASRTHHLAQPGAMSTKRE